MRTLHRRRRALLGFTLIEVMVAVAILSMGLVAYFANQAQVIRQADRARKTALATVLARCKMGELEEHLARDGMPAISETGSDQCCDDGELEGFDCDWKVERIRLPDPAEGGSADGASAATRPPGAAGGAPPGTIGAQGAGADPLSAIAAAAGGAPGSGHSPADQVSSMLQGNGGGDMLTTIAMQFAYPTLKPSIEEQVRRVTITVRWKEGTGSHSFDVVRFIVSDQPPPALMPGGFPPGAGAGGLPGAVPGSGGVPGATGLGATNNLPGIR